jgi:osmotically inducible protein OsmC
MRGGYAMPIRKGFAVWEGSIRDGKGSVSLESGLFEGPYSFSTRFENAMGTNPEELIGAAHAGCFSMALAGVLGQKGKPPRKIETTAEVRIEMEGQGFRIISSALRTTADVPGISEEDFLRAADEAKANCPVSRALTGVKITLEAQLKK